MIRLTTEEFFSDLSTNAMGTETKIQELVALLDATQKGIVIDGIIFRNENEIRNYLIEKGILDNDDAR